MRARPGTSLGAALVLASLSACTAPSGPFSREEGQEALREILPDLKTCIGHGNAAARRLRQLGGYISDTNAYYGGAISDASSIDTARALAHQQSEMIAREAGAASPYLRLDLQGAKRTCDGLPERLRDIEQRYPADMRGAIYLCAAAAEDALELAASDGTDGVIYKNAAQLPTGCVDWIKEGAEKHGFAYWPYRKPQPTVPAGDRDAATPTDAPTTDAPLPSEPAAGRAAGDNGGVADAEAPADDAREEGGQSTGAGAMLVSSDDYPSAAIEAHEEGDARAQFMMSGGRAVRGSCRVVASSGSASLDKRTCQLVEQRFRGDPASDGHVAEHTVNWRLPRG